MKLSLLLFFKKTNIISFKQIQINTFFLIKYNLLNKKNLFKKNSLKKKFKKNFFLKFLKKKQKSFFFFNKFIQYFLENFFKKKIIFNLKKGSCKLMLKQLGNFYFFGKFFKKNLKVSKQIIGILYYSILLKDSFIFLNFFKKKF